MDKFFDSIVRIYKNKKEPTGTGYLIKDYVVTVDHVIPFDLKENDVVSFGYFDSDEEKHFDAEIVYRDRKLDLAFLRVNGDEIQSGYKILCSYRRKIDGSVEFKGFPLYQNPEPYYHNEMQRVSGIYDVENRIVCTSEYPYEGIRCTIKGTGTEPCEGFSGAPVFCNDCLIGFISNTPQDNQGVFSYIPISVFRDAAGGNFTHLFPDYICELLINQVKKQIAFTQSSILKLVLDPALYTSGIDEDQKRYIVNGNQTALLSKISDMEKNNDYNNNKRHIIMIGDGGIGKTATMIGSCIEMLNQQKPAIYIPLRDLKSRSIKDYIIEVIMKESNLDAKYKDHSDVFNKIFSEYSRVFLFIDGFNEIVNTDDILDEINKLKEIQKVVIVLSSRRSIEYDCRECFAPQIFTMQRLGWENVKDYLRNQKPPIAIPSEDSMSDVLGIPLMLKLYVEILQTDPEINRNMVNSPFIRLKKKMLIPSDILWNYIQCQMYRAMESHTYRAMESHTYRAMESHTKSLVEKMMLIVISEYIVPYLASRLNKDRVYQESTDIIVNYLNEGLNRFKECFNEMTSMGKSIYDNRFAKIIRKKKGLKHDFLQELNVSDGDDLFWKLTSHLNILFEREDEKCFFEHQDFQDVFHMIHIEKGLDMPGIKLYEDCFLNSILPIDVISMMAKKMSTEDFDELWSKVIEVPADKKGIRNLIELAKIFYNNDLSSIKFDEIDLRDVNLLGITLSSGKSEASFQRSKVNRLTFFASGHSAPVADVTTTEEDDLFVSVGYDNKVRLWGLKSNECISILTGHTHYVRCVSWSYKNNKIASGGDDRTIRLWTPRTNRDHLTEDFSVCRHSAWVFAMDWNYSGTRLASGDSDGNLIIWQYSSNELKYVKTINEHKQRINCISWSPINNDIFVSGSNGGLLCLYNLAVDQYRHFPIEKGNVVDVAWSPSGKYIAIAARNQVIILDALSIIHEGERKWDEFIIVKMQCSAHAIKRIVWTSKLLAVANGNSIHIWDINKLTSEKVDHCVVWDMDKGYCIEHIDNGNPINCLKYLHVDNALVCGSDDGNLRAWKPRNITWQKSWICSRIYQGSSMSVRCTAWSDNCELLAAGYDDNLLRIWNIKEKRCINIYKGHSNRIKCVAWSPNNKVIASGANDNTILLWNMETGKCENVPMKHGGAVNTLLWLDDRRLISGSDDKIVRIWDLDTGTCKDFIGHQDSVYSVALSPDKKRMVSGSDDKTLRFWDIEKGECYNWIPSESGIGHDKPIRCVAWSPSVERPIVFSGSNDNSIRRWDPETGQPTSKAHILTGHSDFVYTLDLSPQDGKYMVSGSTDKTLRLWKSSSGEKIPFNANHDGYVWHVKWSPDSNLIASAASDGHIYIWNTKIKDDIKLEFKLTAIPGLNIIGCNFTDASFEDDQLKYLLEMNGAKV